MMAAGGRTMWFAVASPSSSSSSSISSMWWSNHKKEDHGEDARTPNSRKSFLGSAKKKAFSSARSWRQEEQAAASAPSSPSSNSVRVAETLSGIEVSFSEELLTASPIKEAQKEGVISKRELLLRRRRVGRSQYRMTTTTTTASSKDKPSAVISFQPAKHRVPLFNILPKMSPFDDVLFLLRSHQVRNEISSVRAELGLLDKEIKALEGDRGKMEQMALKIGGGKQADDDDDWDINRTLSHGKISQGQRTLLQEQRGLLLTVNLHNEQARETFLTKCGASATLLRTLQQKAKKSSRPNDPSLALVCLTPDNCRDGGAATTIQNVALMQGATCESAFFISRDKGKSFYWGHLPDRLFRRMKNAGLDPKRHASDLVYVATGAYGCYYAEFRSGERWWGSVSDDMEFDKICADPEWDVHRVAFGPCVTLTDHYGLKNVSPSWVILSRDGRVAWKNLPARLNNLLERRLASEAAPVEVSLGSGGSYFVRFLDGTVDYCLPLAAAKVVQDLEHKGTVITSVAMHCELPNDFIIRHR